MVPGVALEPDDQPSRRRLVCAECGRRADADAEGWRAFLTSDEPEEVATFCLDCAEREFGRAFRRC
jgi:hypothetical protein